MNLENHFQHPLEAARRLDTLEPAIYIAAMIRKVVAASLVTVWLALFGIEFSEDIGLIEYSEPDMDKSVEATLASLGEAIKISDDTQVTMLQPLPAPPVAIYPSAINIVSFRWVRKDAKFLKEDIPLYKIDRVLLL